MPTCKEAERLLFIGEKLDENIQGLIRGTRKAGGVINTSVVVAMAMGIVSTKDPSLLHENGGHLVITSSWAKSLLKRIAWICEKKEFKHW